MPNPKLAELLGVMEDVDARRKFNKLLFFKPYPKQKRFFDFGASKRERLFMAGNRVGKSEAGAFEAALHATGDYPGWWEGKRFDHPTRGWIAGVTSVDVRDIQQKKLCGQPGVVAEHGTGYLPKDRIIDVSKTHGVTDAFDTIQVLHKTNGVEDGISTITEKSYEQGRTKFQGDEIDWGWGDEEGPSDVYAEFLARLSPNGILFTTFTPLLGPTELVDRFRKEAHPDRAWVNMTLDEAEHFTAEEKRKRFEGYRKHEREARARGEPLLGSGRVFQYDEETLKEDSILYIPEGWCKLWGIDFGINHPFAAVLILWDKDNDVIHVHHTIRMADALILQHAAAMKPIGVNVPVAWPQDGTQRDRKTGEPTAALYRQQGLRLLPTHATFADGSMSTEDGVAEMDLRMATGRLKVARHLVDWFEEYRGYHRRDGLIVKQRDDIMSATRIAVMAKRFAGRLPIGGIANRRRTNLIAKDIDFDLS